MENGNYKQNRTLVLFVLPWMIITIFFYFGVYVLQMDVYDFSYFLSWGGVIFVLGSVQASFFWLLLSIVALASAHKAKKAGCEKIAWVYRLAITEIIIFSAATFHVASELFASNL